MLTILAHDCGMLSSKSTLVTVYVRARCADGIKQSGDADIPIYNLKQQQTSNGKRIASDLKINFCPRVSKAVFYLFKLLN